MVSDGSRRRTPGGVFFLLIKERVPIETTKHIFKKRSLYQQAAQKRKKPRRSRRRQHLGSQEQHRWPGRMG